MIFLIALLPALVVFCVAAISESRVKTTVAAFIAAAVGVLTGNPAYMALDLLFVIIAYWISMSTLSSDSDAKPLPVAPKPAPRVAKGDSDIGTTLCVLGGLGILAYVIFGFDSNHKPATQLTPAAVARLPIAPSTRSYVPALPQPKTPPAVVTMQPKRPPKSPLQRCLEIKSEEKMAKCLENLG